MPNGSRSSLAYSSVCRGLPSAPMPRKTTIVPMWLSAKNTSPLGAARMSRGFLSPLAKSSTLKPGGAFGQAPAGRGIIVGPLSVRSEGSGCGRSRTVMWCTVPGDWVRKSLNGVSEGPRFGASRASVRCCAKLPRITAAKANTMRFIMLRHQSPIPRVRCQRTASAMTPRNGITTPPFLLVLDVECHARVTSVDS